MKDLQECTSKMDSWQKHTFDRCSAFVGEDFKYEVNEVTMGFNKSEVYVIMKAFEDQQRYLHPLLEVKDEK